MYDNYSSVNLMLVINQSQLILKCLLGAKRSRDLTILFPPIQLTITCFDKAPGDSGVWLDLNSFS